METRSDSHLHDAPQVDQAADRRLNDNVFPSAREEAIAEAGGLESPGMAEAAGTAPAPRRIPSIDSAQLKRLVAAQPTKAALMAVAAGAVAMSVARYALQKRRARNHSPY